VARVRESDCSDDSIVSSGAGGGRNLISLLSFHSVLTFTLNLVITINVVLVLYCI